MEHNLESLNLADYYKSLSRKNKANFLKYLMVTYDLNYSTMYRKIIGTAGCNLNKLERMACNEAIQKEDVWMQ